MDIGQSNIKRGNEDDKISDHIIGFPLFEEHRFCKELINPCFLFFGIFGRKNCQILSGDGWWFYRKYVQREPWLPSKICNEKARIRKGGVY